MQKVLHFHIPKTGGTAIRHYMIGQLGVERVSPSVVGLRIGDALLRWGDFDVVSGHFIAHQCDQLPTDRCNIVVLRNPIDRFLSDYSYSKSDNADRLLNTKVHALELDAYLESLSLQQIESLSLQVEILYPFGTSSRIKLTGDEKLAAATETLARFQLVGIQDELEDFVCMLDANFLWNSMPLAKKNVTSQRVQADRLLPEQARKLRNLLEREFEFYDRAKERFKRDRRDLIKRAVVVPGPSKTAEASNADKVTCVSRQEKTNEFGDRRCMAKLVTASGRISGNGLAMVGEELTISIDLVAKVPIDQLNVGIAIKDERGLLVFGTNSMLLGHVYSLEPGGYTIQFTVLNRAPLGKYLVDVALVRDETHYQGCYHWLESAASFEIHEKATSHFEGHILMDADVEMIAVTPEASWIHVPYVSSSHLIRSFGRINKPLTQFSSSVAPMCDAGHLYTGIDVFLPMRVENKSQEIWRASGQQPVVLTYRWLTSENEIVVADGLRTRLPADVAPGSAVIVPLQVRTPSESGCFQLVVSLVQETVAWFVDKDPASSFIAMIDIQDSIQAAS